MRLSHACPPSCKRPRVDETTPEVAFQRERILRKVDELVADGMRRAKAVAFMEAPKSTYYDWRKAHRRGGVKALVPKSTAPRRVRRRRWTNRDRRRVERERQRRPWAGRAAIHAIPARRHTDFAISAATVGRIIRKAVDAGRLRPAAHCEGRAGPKRRRTFDGHAQRLKPGMKAAQPGELVQIDHMTVHADGRTLKQFHAKDPITKALHARACSGATARAAASFLDEAARRMPIRSVQVDGGSEFMADFEEAYRRRGPPLHVLPPRRPDLNGSVERSNRTLRTEFRSTYAGELTVRAVNEALRDYLDDYHEVRPHQALGWLTPNQFRDILGVAA